MPEYNFERRVAENVLEKKDQFDEHGNELRLAPHEVWLLMILNQTFGAKIYGDEKMIDFARKCSEALKRG